MTTAVPEAEDVPSAGARETPSSRSSAASVDVSVPADTFREHLVVGSKSATIAYWATLSLIFVAIFVPKLLPCTDYPQHLALADIGRRLANPNAPEHAHYWINYFTYNGLFHVLVANLGRLVPIELAGKFVLASSLFLLGGSVLGLLRAVGRPPALAALFVPVLFSFAVGWGFANYALGTALAVLTAALIAQSLRRPRRVLTLAVVLFGLLCAMAHVLGMLLLCVLTLAMAPELSLRAFEQEPLARRVPRAFLRCVIALAPLLLGAAWCLAVYKVQYAWDPGMYKDPTLEGTSPPVWQKLVFFGAWATGVHSDLSDQILVFVALAVALAAVAMRVFRRDRERDGDRSTEHGALLLPMIGIFAAYLLTPMVFIGTHLIFPRLAQPVVLGILLATPAWPKRLASRAETTALAVGLIAAANLVVHMGIFAYETNDASRVIDEAPRGRKATAVVYDSETFSFRNGTLVHLAAYYAARKEGDWAFAFARYLSVPVRYTKNGAPPWPYRGWEFGPHEYNPRCKYARNFDLVFVKVPDDWDEGPAMEPFVRKLVFKQDAFAVKLVSHHGHYWAFDSAGLPEDGTY